MIGHYFIVYKKLEHPFSLKFDPYDNSPVELTLYNYLGLFIFPTDEKGSEMLSNFPKIIQFELTDLGFEEVLFSPDSMFSIIIAS